MTKLMTPGLCAALLGLISPTWAQGYGSANLPPVLASQDRMQPSQPTPGTYTSAATWQNGNGTGPTLVIEKIDGRDIKGYLWGWNIHNGVSCRYVDYFNRPAVGDACHPTATAVSTATHYK